MEKVVGTSNAVDWPPVREVDPATTWWLLAGVAGGGAVAVAVNRLTQPFANLVVADTAAAGEGSLVTQMVAVDGVLQRLLPATGRLTTLLLLAVAFGCVAWLARARGATGSWSVGDAAVRLLAWTGAFLAVVPGALQEGATGLLVGWAGLDGRYAAPQAEIAVAWLVLSALVLLARRRRRRRAGRGTAPGR